jgi:starvation-inducible DNA-binding protein
LFETFAVGLSAQVDLIAERAVTLGATVNGTARYVAASSGIPDYDAATRRDLDHARALVARFGTFVARLHESRNTANECGDTDTVDLLTGVITEFEKHGWFLRATLDEA